jgi:hypothetical protein
MQILHSSSCFGSAGLRNDSDISIGRRIRPVSCSTLDRSRVWHCHTPQTAQIDTRHVHVAGAVAAPDHAPEAEQAAEVADIPSVLGAAEVEEFTGPSIDIPRLADLQLQAIINPEVSLSQWCANLAGKWASNTIRAWLPRGLANVREMPFVTRTNRICSLVA